MLPAHARLYCFRFLLKNNVGFALRKCFKVHGSNFKIPATAGQSGLEVFDYPIFKFICNYSETMFVALCAVIASTTTCPTRSVTYVCFASFPKEYFVSERDSFGKMTLILFFQKTGSIVFIEKNLNEEYE